MAAVGESIAVIDKSGKLVSTGKHLFGVFSHAKNAYRERKSQIKTEKSAKIAEKEALKAMQRYTIDDAPPPSTTSSRRHRGAPSHHSGRSHHHRRRHRRSSHYEQDLHFAVSGPEPFYPPPQVSRRHTHHDISTREPLPRPVTSRSKSDAHIDMDLAYGDCHPSALARHQPPEIQDNELKGLVNRAEWLLDEANCMHHTATATIAHLQKNPDAMAAVALTLAEISNLATKMAPAALSALKTAAPAVWALLASPQFLIAAGVGLGVTVVMFGGYKIVKRIKSGNINSPNAEAGWQGERPRGHSPSMEEMMELNTECLSHVEKWRRGVADAEAESVGTSVEGEFITPTAAAMSRLDVTSARGGGSRSRYGDEDASVATTRRSRRSRAHHRSSARASSVDANSRLKSKPKSESGARSKRGDGSKAESRSDTGKGKRKEKEKKGPSRLRQMFMP